MKYVMLLILLAGCTSIHYEKGDETLSVRTLFKSVDGFSAIRTPQVVGVKIASTNTDDDDVFEAVANILEFYK